MLATSAAFQTMIQSVEQTAVWRVQITLPGGVYPDVTLAVSAVSINASTVSDQPDGTRLQVGYPSMGADFTLGGLVDATDESKTAAWLFGPYSTTSPLYRSNALYAAVTIDIGLYTDAGAGVPEFVRKFTGVVDDYTCNEDGSVSFSCIDSLRARLRSVSTLTAVITAPPYNAGLTSEFALDYLLRAASGGSTSSWPAQRAQCVLAAGLRTSLWPEVGTIDPSITQPIASFGDCVFGRGLGYQADPLGLGTPVSYVTQSAIGTSAFVEFFTKITGSQILVQLGSSVEHVQIIVNTGSGVVISAQMNSGVIASSPGTGALSGSHYIGVAIVLPAVGASGVSGTIYIDSTPFTFSLTTTNRAFTMTRVQVVSDTAATVAGLQVTTESGTPARNDTFTPKAVLDASFNSMDVIPEIPAGDPWQALQQIADAELAVAGGDESGIFRFYNRATIRGMASQRAITSATSLAGVGGIETTAAAVVNRATVEYTGWNFATANTTIWSAGKARRVPKGGTLTLNANASTLFANPSTTPSVLPNNSTDVTTSHYRASTDSAGTTEFGGTLTFTITATGPNTLRIVVANLSGGDAWLVSPANYTDLPVGTPLLRIAGIAVTQADTLTADYQYPNPASSSKYGEQATEITGNPWIQNDTTAATLAQDVVQDMYLPRPNLTAVAIVPDPRLQLIDVVHIQDPDRSLLDEYARIFGWTISWEAGDDGPSNYAMTLDARTVALPGGWIGGLAGRSEGGVTTYGY